LIATPQTIVFTQFVLLQSMQLTPCGYNVDFATGP